MLALCSDCRVSARLHGQGECVASSAQPESEDIRAYFTALLICMPGRSTKTDGLLLHQMKILVFPRLPEQQSHCHMTSRSTPHGKSILKYTPHGNIMLKHTYLKMSAVRVVFALPYTAACTLAMNFAISRPLNPSILAAAVSSSCSLTSSATLMRSAASLRPLTIMLSR